MTGGAPPVRISGYLVSEELGTGGYSRVYRATPEGGGAPVALKVAVRPELAGRLRAEGVVLRRLSHPRLVRILAEHLDADPPCFVLELCEGGDLRALLEAQEGRRLAPERALVLLRGVLEGVAFAHGEGVVHGDLKPENVLLDAAGEPKVADLGLSRELRRELLGVELVRSRSIRSTAAEPVRGTFDYLAPEVRRGGAVTPRSDVFALGVLAYEVLVGARPLGAFRLPGEVLREGGAAVPVALDRVVARALQSDPRARHADAGEMLADLEAGAAGLAPPPSAAAAPPGPNPLLLETNREALLDALALGVVPALLWSVTPGACLLLLGLPDVALGLALVVATACALVVAPGFLWNRLARWWIRFTTARALARGGDP